MKNILIALLFLLGIGAIYGGGCMIIDPSGELLGVPSSMLESSPFGNFLLPGLMLFMLLGIAPLVVIRGLIRKSQIKFAEILNAFKDMHWAWSFTIYIAIALIIWIQVQMSFIKDVHWSHTLYIFWALLILFLALLPTVRKEYTN